MSAVVGMLTGPAVLRERIGAGIRWLDEHAEMGWRERIDRGRLAMHDACGCICGQIFAEKVAALGDYGPKTGYDVAISIVRGEAFAWGVPGGDTGYWARDCGFVPDWEAADRIGDFFGD